jgi:ceramide glucosyltransferase
MSHSTLNRRAGSRLQVAAWWLAAVYALDRVLKLLAVHRFFRRPPHPPAPPARPAATQAAWPAVSLLQPITRGASDLPSALACRAALTYPGRIQHLLICDGADTETLARCRAWQLDHPDLTVEIIAVETPGGDVADKVSKLCAALPKASGDILAFVDDDILLRPGAVTGLAGALQNPRAGAVFGLAAYVDWSNIPSSLLSAFVNANALLSYLPLTFLTEPFTITGHFYALRRDVFYAIGGLDGMAGRFDDDHELARRVMRHGLANVQTPVVYDVHNHLATLDDYANQMRRWFIIPRQTMAPYLTPYQQLVSLLGSAGNLLPPLLAAMAVFGGLAGSLPGSGARARPNRKQRGAAKKLASPAAPLLASLALFAAAYAWCEHAYLGRKTPGPRWPLVLLSALIAPLQALGGLLGDPLGGPHGGNTFLWRGCRIRLHRGGRYEIVRGQGGKPR